MKQLKTVNKLLCLLLALSATLAVHAQTFFNYTYSGKTLRYRVIDGTMNVRVSDGNNKTTLGSITIPSTVTYDGQSYTVTEITAHGFEENLGLTSVIYPTTLTSIGSNAFGGCSNLTKFVSGSSSYKVCKISSNITMLGEMCFAGCGFESAQLSLDKISGDQGKRCFQSCTKLNTVVASGVISNSMFLDCTALTFFSMSSSTNLNPKIGDYAFSGCTSLQTVGFSSSTSCKTLGYMAFKGVTSLTSITLPAGLEKVGDYAFYECSNLSNVTFPGTLTTIGKSAFNSCNLTSVTIPANVNNIGTLAFAANMQLADVKVMSNDIASYPCNGSDDYHSFTSMFAGNHVRKVSFMGNVTSIGSNLCKGMNYLETVELPSTGIDEIGNGAFMSCQNLSTINKIVCGRIGEDAFNGCAFVELDINAPIIGPNAFSRNYALRHAVLRRLNENISPCFLMSGVGGAQLDILPAGPLDEASEGVYSPLMLSNFETITFDSRNQDINFCLFMNCPQLKVVNIKNPGEISMDVKFAESCPYLREYRLDGGAETSGTLMVKDGCVYSLDGTKLILAPEGKRSPIRLLPTVREVGVNASYGNLVFDLSYVKTPAELPTFNLYNPYEAPTLLLSLNGYYAMNEAWEDNALLLQRFGEKMIITSAQPGDIDMDGKVTITDVTLLTKMLLEQP